MPSLNHYRLRLALTVVDAAEFVWSNTPGGKVGVGDVTSLPEHLISKVWKDSNDLGFMVRGRSRTLLFVHVRDVRDADNDLTYQAFQCHEFPQLEVHVYND